MYEDNIRPIVENFPDDMFFDNIPREEQIAQYLDAIKCQWELLANDSSWRLVTTP